MTLKELLHLVSEAFQATSPCTWLVAAMVAATAAFLLLWIRAEWRITMLRFDLRHERASHWRTFEAFSAKQRQIGRLEVHIEGLKEIAAASAVGARLYQALIEQLRASDQPPGPVEAEGETLR